MVQNVMKSRNSQKNTKNQDADSPLTPGYVHVKKDCISRFLLENAQRSFQTLALLLFYAQQQKTL